jgi:hypothetical protein
VLCIALIATHQFLKRGLAADRLANESVVAVFGNSGAEDFAAA